MTEGEEFINKLLRYPDMANLNESGGVGAQGSTSLKEQYYKWCELEAKKINSDGCTAVSEWNQPCCFEHDLACHYEKDPRKAFESYLRGMGQHGKDDYWFYAPKFSRREADKRFAECNLANSSVKRPWEFVRSLGRYIGVRIGSIWPF